MSGRTTPNKGFSTSRERRPSENEDEKEERCKLPARKEYITGKP